MMDVQGDGRTRGGNGRKAAARAHELPSPAVDAFRGRHLILTRRQVATETGHTIVTVDESESPLAWLACRRGRDGRALIAPEQLQAGERLRADFTIAHLMPRTTSSWASPIANGRRGAGDYAGLATEVMVAARQNVRHALDTVGPEFAGLLVDVCCFLKGLEDVERERQWPRRTAKVVLQLGLDRLARHYGFAQEARGAAHAHLRTWLAEDATFRVE
jgi:hypothetical protein